MSQIKIKNVYKINNKKCYKKNFFITIQNTFFFFFKKIKLMGKF